MATDERISFTRGETLDIAAALETAAQVLAGLGKPEHVMVIYELEEASAMVLDRLWPGEGPVA